MNIKIKITLFFFLAIVLKSVAQTSWTLEECIDHALEHNLLLKDFQYTNDANKEDYKQSIRNLLPVLNAGSNYQVNSGRAEDPNTGTFVVQDFFSNNYSIQSNIDLFQGFQKLNSIKASKFLYQAAKEERTQQRYLLAFRVMQAFNNIRFFEGLVAIATEQVNVSKTNFKLVEKQIELGLMAGADMYEAKSSLLSDELNLTQSTNQLAAAKLALIQEMNLENTSDIEIVADLKISDGDTVSSEMESDTIYAKAREFLPLIKAQELRAQAAKKQVGVTRGRLYPSLSLFAGMGTGYFETFRDSLGNTLPFREQFRDNFSRFYGLSLNVPISNGWSARSRVKQAKIERLRQENNLEVQEQVLFQTIQELVQEHNALLVEKGQSDQNVEAQRMAFTVAQKRFENGMINGIELLTAKNLFASAQNENLQVTLRSAINKSTLDFYRGLPVFNIN
ncbi:TolC family protein [Maribacter sp. MJ134]|uniref:TolC family protein n=1 Tax=Maribacter sp. MJ134 TaxID=2496865 RepID=UPI000F843637|nr:TolC family protein [Maribacter sp. MJ134]AZQ60171.1 TolC family protein [Maribacter sp. MJ134]